MLNSVLVYHIAVCPRKSPAVMRVTQELPTVVNAGRSGGGSSTEAPKFNATAGKHHLYQAANRTKLFHNPAFKCVDLTISINDIR